eukprot:1453409-Rhodomonas_salina.1
MAATSDAQVPAQLSQNTSEIPPCQQHTLVLGITLVVRGIWCSKAPFQDSLYRDCGFLYAISNVEMAALAVYMC